MSTKRYIVHRKRSTCECEDGKRDKVEVFTYEEEEESSLLSLNRGLVYGALYLTQHPYITQHTRGTVGSHVMHPGSSCGLRALLRGLSAVHWSGIEPATLQFQARSPKW